MKIVEKEGMSLYKKWAIGFAVVLVLAFYSEATKGTEDNIVDTAKVQKSRVMIGGKGITKSGFYASASHDLLDKAIDYIIAKDYDAVQKMRKEGYIFTMRPGLIVYVTDIKIFGGLVKVRPEGDIVEFWTFREAVE